jgi:hypothetical protein
MSAGPKVAGFAVLLRIFLYTLEPLHAHSTAILAGLAVLTMAVGNVLALAQTNIKRMLAYSSIAHAGYALVGLAAGGPEGAASVMLYVCIYALMNMGAFGVVIMLRKAGKRGEEITDFAGLGKTNKTARSSSHLHVLLTGIPLAGSSESSTFLIRNRGRPCRHSRACCSAVSPTYLRMSCERAEGRHRALNRSVPRARTCDLGDRRDRHRRVPDQPPELRARFDRGDHVAVYLDIIKGQAACLAFFLLSSRVVSHRSNSVISRE